MPASQHFRRAAADFREIEDAFAFAVVLLKHSEAPQGGTDGPLEEAHDVRAPVRRAVAGRGQALEQAASQPRHEREERRASSRPDGCWTFEPLPSADLAGQDLLVQLDHVRQLHVAMLSADGDRDDPL